ncbi:Glu-tRNA(Gln) amidotransferase GatDE subunit E [Candidatus Micrarchaeota archaeon CG10_big_fil_rev_8_21_14_0_10_45_29]|nr:MAG: Glu-tRNA(Gln) amidotransferase GatDE subunit E [Candidatus Micrarchaeota archaeon CG10_big_fil_rev_8_21_14_0_10_45_29]
MLCGLEIHQRLEGKKLFNSCPTPLPDQKLPENCARITRMLNTAASELGVIDSASKFEHSRSRTFEYLAPEDFSCLVDSDEEPPTSINKEALLQALKFSKHINASIVDEVQVMRKAVTDGSNPSGFQRTSLISIGGELKYEGGEIPITSLCIEEESAGIISSNPDSVSYRLDRMGVPLIEISTEPVFTSAEEAAKGAQALGMALRMLDKVMRGLGTIRQDVNVSIPGGARVEIKGLQDLHLLKTLVENEVRRQEALAKISAEIKKRHKKMPTSLPFEDAGEIFLSTKSRLISKALESGGAVLAAKLPLFAGILGTELYSEKRFGSELSDYAKQAGGVKGLIHSDEDMQKYSISPQEAEALKKFLKIKKEDAFILIADKKERAEPAIIAALSRALVLCVPGETRKADEKGGSSFMRPLAGAHRMYPETDVRPILITKELLQEAGELVSVGKREKELCSLLGDDFGKRMLRSRNLPLFERLIANGADAKLAAITLEQTLVALRREGIDISLIGEDSLMEIFSLYKNEKITKASFEPLLRLCSGSPEKSIASLARENNLQKISGQELEALWKKEGGDMRKFMSKYGLVADAAEIMKMAKKKN